MGGLADWPGLGHTHPLGDDSLGASEGLEKSHFFRTKVQVVNLF